MASSNTVQTSRPFIRIVIRRLIARLVLLFGVINFNFFIFQVIPQLVGLNPLEFYVPPSFKTSLNRNAIIEGLEKSYGLNQPICIRYIDYIKDLFTFNFGESLYYQEPILKLIEQNFPVTAEIVIPSLIITTIMAIFFGIYSATKEGKVSDHVISNAAIITYFIPAFWLGFIIWYYLTIQYNLFPSSYTFAIIESRKDPLAIYTVLIPPILTLSFTSFGVRTILMRNNSIDVFNQDFVTILKAKGVPRSRILFRHVFKNSFLPVFTRVGIDFAFLLSGVVFVCDVFNISGLGTLLVTAAENFDIFLLEGDFYIISLFAIVVLTLMDFIYILIDPRVKLT
ncbi:binding-protein-dependent transport, inner membrane component [Acidianus hospitalis W1]|uniref:Binding-protein-dependent transport, inner membrane component n=1 Tax=Acidianus hospitalis (strain W1) TaxID=933801 RepID=F4B4H5_ACIHW|nr:ABC transporter permease [Acidianus hospitalis]AEE93064.1 binding-protein-dependent transport, inner membrane component [Acidianus hospitalis W1]